MSFDSKHIISFLLILIESVYFLGFTLVACIGRNQKKKYIIILSTRWSGPISICYMTGNGMEMGKHTDAHSEHFGSHFLGFNVTLMFPCCYLLKSLIPNGN